MRSWGIGQNRLIKFLLLWLVLGCSLYTTVCFAGGGGGGFTIGSVAQNVQKSFGDLAKLVTAGAYIAGMGFGLAAILKFKAHKDNPTQIPVGTPIALLFIAAALLFLPTIFKVSGDTLFGTSGSAGGISGITSF